MSDHPSTYEGTPVNSGEHAWDDRAALHAKSTADGILSGANALKRGTFAEMIRTLNEMPREKRDEYVIEKAGDRKYSAAEAEALASREDFPAR